MDDRFFLWGLTNAAEDTDGRGGDVVTRELEAVSVFVFDVRCPVVLA